jgi:cell division protein FtsB
MSEFLKSKLASLGLVVLVGALIVSMLSIRAQKFEVQQQAHDLEGKIISLQQENEYLQKFGNYFKSTAFLEKEARKKLNFKAPGEEVVFVYDGKANISSKSREFQARLVTMANWKKWMYYMLGK